MTLRRQVSFWCGAILLLAGGCHRTTAPESHVPSLPFPGFGLPPFKPVQLELPPPPPLDLGRLDFAEFIPPGAQRVGPRHSLGAGLASLRRTRFPSAELCASPDRVWVLFHDGMKRNSTIFHWLMLLKNDAQFPNSIYCTTTAFEASWSQDSRRFAVTDFVGHNSSELFVENVEELGRRPVNIRPLIEEHFPLRVMSAPMFVKAYRWTTDGRLVVRAIGRVEEEPCDEFGCEAVVDFATPNGGPRASYLCGYILRRAAN